MDGRLKIPMQRLPSTWDSLAPKEHELYLPALNAIPSPKFRLTRRRKRKEEYVFRCLLGSRFTIVTVMSSFSIASIRTKPGTDHGNLESWPSTNALKAACLSVTTPLETLAARFLSALLASLYAATSTFLNASTY
jgi:hypothetical protein